MVILVLGVFAACGVALVGACVLFNYALMIHEPADRENTEKHQ